MSIVSDEHATVSGGADESRDMLVASQPPRLPSLTRIRAVREEPVERVALGCELIEVRSVAVPIAVAAKCTGRNTAQGDKNRIHGVTTLCDGCVKNNRQGRHRHCTFARHG